MVLITHHIQSIVPIIIRYICELSLIYGSAGWNRYAPLFFDVHYILILFVCRFDYSQFHQTNACSLYQNTEMIEIT